MTDYHYRHIDGYDPMVAARVPYWELSSGARRYLDHTDLIFKKGKAVQARELTSPYGLLGWAIGSSDDFHCFDYALLPDGRVILHSTLNSETGSFIVDVGYYVVPPEQAVGQAVRMVDDALGWCAENGVRPSMRGWNQDPYYWARCVGRSVGHPGALKASKGRLLRPDKRRAWAAVKLPHAPEVERVHDPEALVLVFGNGYRSEPVLVLPDDDVYAVLLAYMQQQDWLTHQPGERRCPKK